MRKITDISHWLRGEASDEAIDWAFDNGRCKGDREYWKKRLATKEEWKMFWKAFRD